MQYVGKVFSTVSQLYKELNPATLSGAIDIIVVEGRDGELSCSPFHVRFGKLQLLRPSDKAVQVIVNGKEAEFYMKVGVEGEGFFVLETQGEVPSEFATSPVASPTLSYRDAEDPDFLDLSGNVNSDEHNKDGYVSAPSAHESEDEHEAEWSADEEHLHADVSRKSARHIRRVSSASVNMRCATPAADSMGTANYAEHGDGMWLPRSEDEPAPVTFLDDTVVGTKFKGRGGPVTDATLEQIKRGLRGQTAETVMSLERHVSNDAATVARHRRPMSVVSDSAYVLDPFGASGTPPEVSDGATHTGWDWGVGVPAQKQAAVEDLPPVASNSVAATAAAAAASVIPQKTHSIDTSQMILAQGSSNKRPLSISLCGIESLQSAADAAAQEQVFAASLVDSAVFKRDAMGIITDPLAVFRTSDGKYSQSEPLVMSLIAQLAFGESLDGFNMAAPTGADAEGIVTIAESQREHKPDANDGTEGLKTSSKEAGEDRDAVEPAAAGVSDAATATETKPVGGRRWWQWGQRNTPALTITTAATNLPTSVVHAQTMPAPGGTDDKPVMPADAVSINIPPRRDIHSDGAADDYDDEEEEARFAQHTHYAKTLRLTSAQLKSLGLQRGANTVKFLVPSNKAYCEAKIFYYRHDTQIVISDIDGTITKSDALGHLFNMVGKDWTHTGVAKLYTDIARNGYEILYLTSRAIGQAAGTRVFLDTVKQGDYILPLGPLLLSPDRLFTSFHREVIMRRPHEFKMACLRDIKNLFDGASPFYAGFGNRITDAMSYRSVNVPVSRICTIDTSGEVKLELLPGYRSSYVKMNDLVDMMFPPLSSKLDPKFNDWEYWKTSLPSIDGDLAEIEAQLEAEKEAKRQEEERERLHKAALEDGRKSPSIFTRATRATRAASSIQPIDAVPPSLSPSQTAIGADSRARADSWAPPPPPQQLPPSPPVGASDSLEQTTVVQPPLVAVPTPQSGMALVQPIGIPPSRDTSSGSGRGDTTQRVSSMASNGSVSSNGNSRMSMLQKVNPFNLVRGSSPPAPANGINSNSGVEQSAFPQLKGSPPRTSELNNGGGSQLSLTDDPDVAAAASRLVPQFSKVSIESKNASDDEEYSDADDVDSEIDDSEIDDSEIDNDDDDEDDGDDEIDQETMNIIHDLDEIQYL